MVYEVFEIDMNALLRFITSYVIFVVFQRSHFAPFSEPSFFLNISSIMFPSQNSNIFVKILDFEIMQKLHKSTITSVHSRSLSTSLYSVDPIFKKFLLNFIFYLLISGRFGIQTCYLLVPTSTSLFVHSRLTQ